MNHSCLLKWPLPSKQLSQLWPDLIQLSPGFQSFCLLSLHCTCHRHSWDISPLASLLCALWIMQVWLPGRQGCLLAILTYLYNLVTLFLVALQGLRGSKWEKPWINKAMWTDRKSTHIAFSIMLIWVHILVSSFNRHVTSGRSASSVNSFFLSGNWVGGTDH